MNGEDATSRPVGTDILGGRYLPTLDGWRAIAVLLVIGYHGRGSLIASRLLASGGWADAVVMHGTLGVDLFFGISGLLITSRLLEEQGVSGRISLRNFYVRRAFRILPLIFAFLAVLDACVLAGKHIASPAELLSCLGFVRNYLPGRLVEPASGGWYTAHFWSLAIEEQFYLFWPVLLVALGRRRAPGAAVVLAIAVAVWRGLDASHRSLQLDPSLWNNRTDIRLDGLMWGCVAAFLFTSTRARTLLGRRLNPWTTLVLGASAVLNEVYGTAPLQPFLRALLIPAVLLGTVLNPRSLFSRALEWRSLRWVGWLSYSIYVWQQLFFVAPWAYQLLGGSWAFFPARALGTLTVAVLSHYLLEKPAIRFGRRLIAAPGPSVAPSSAQVAP